MKIKRKIKLTKTCKTLLKILLLIIIIMSIPIIIFKIEENNLLNLEYSKKSSEYIIKNFKYKKIKDIGINASLNAAFSSEHYNEKYFDYYVVITYVDNVDYIKQINSLIEKGYSDSDINNIFKYGNNDEINDFINHDYVDIISKILVKDYAKLKNIDRYIAYQYENFCSWEDAIRYVNLNLDIDAYEVVNENDTFSTTVLVNKNNKLSSSYTPNDLIILDTTYSKSAKEKLSKIAADAFIKMADDARNVGLSIKANSAYRSYSEQQAMYDLYEKTYGSAYALKYVAKAGFSEHQTGLAIDIMSTNNSIFANSDEYKWVIENCYNYGFIPRYPKGKESITRYGYESWHYRYVGVEIAQDIKAKKLTYDEYYMIYIEK